MSTLCLLGIESMLSWSERVNFDFQLSELCGSLCWGGIQIASQSFSQFAIACKVASFEQSGHAFGGL